MQGTELTDNMVDKIRVWELYQDMGLVVDGPEEKMRKGLVFV